MKSRATRARRLGAWTACGLLLSVRLLAQPPAQTVSFSPAAATFGDTISVQLAGAAAGQTIRYEIAAGAEAADRQVTANSPIYSGPLTVNTTSAVRAAVFDNGTRGTVTSGHYVKLDPGLGDFRSELPVLVLDVLGAGPLEKDDVNHASWLYGFGPDMNTGTFAGAADFATPLVATVRGSSSAEFPKKGYNVRMRDAAGAARAVPIFDLPAYERWAFVAPWAFDATYINNAFMYELSNRIGRWAPRTKLVELFFNAAGDDLDPGDYAGIYVVTDRIRAETGRVAIDRLGRSDAAEPAITGGYILQLDPPEAGDVSWRTNRGVPEQPPNEIVLVEPGGGDATPQQVAYIRDYVQRMEDALHADLATGFAQRTYLDYLDRSSWVDHHILNVLASNPDALHRSAYFTKPRGGRLQAGPLWDFDRALGGFWDERDRESVINTWSGLNAAVDVWKAGWWGVLAQDPEFVQDWIDRWQSLRQRELATDALTSLARSLAASVGVDAANRDAARWPDDASPYGSYPAQIEYMQGWLAQRTAWIDAQFVAPPVVSAQAGTITFSPPPGAWLVYTVDGLDPRAAGGAVSPTALIQTGPLTVSATTNVRVRSYAPVPTDRVPSSPWSSLTDAARVSTALTQGRIVNFSSKANLRGGDDSLTIGFVVSDTFGKQLLIRGIGPGLAVFGEPVTLDDPQLIVTGTSGSLLAQSSHWENDPRAAEIAVAGGGVGAFPLVAGSSDAATLVEMPTGNFTAQISSISGAAGSVLGEIYEQDTTGRIANVSIRGRATAEKPLTAGFVVSGGSTRLLIRAIGPTLREFGVNDAAASLRITLRSSSGVIAVNGSWLAGGNAVLIEELGARVGAFPLPPDSQDAALAATIPPGAYTAEVVSPNGGGTVLLEIYDVP